MVSTKRAINELFHYLSIDCKYVIKHSDISITKQAQQKLTSINSLKKKNIIEKVTSYLFCDLKRFELQVAHLRSLDAQQQITYGGIQLPDKSGKFNYYLILY